MKKFRNLTVLLMAFVLGACGSGGPSFTETGTTGGGTTEVGGIQLLAASPQLPSDLTGLQSVELTAVVTDANNNLLEDVQVQFSVPTSNASLGVSQPITDASGTAKASVSSNNNAQNRTVTVTATAGAVSDSVTIQVIGTVLSISGPAALAAGDSAEYSIKLTDSEGAGVSGAAFTVQSAVGNTIASSVSTTGVDGEAIINLTATQGGVDTLTVSALGMAATKQVTVSDDQFAFVNPVAGYEAELGEVVTIELLWESNGAPVVGGTVEFSSTRGTLSALSDDTNGSGIATVTISSTNSGPAVITAVDADTNTSTSVSIEFVATSPDSVELQADPFTITVNEQSSITAIVRDAQDNRVKNQIVYFEISDTTGGSLNAASAETDSLGRAAIVYNAGSSPSSTDGVVITASVRDSNNITIASDTVNLTVAGIERDVTIGTGNELDEIGTALYAKEWAVLVKDGVGNPVPNSTVQVSLQSVNYRKGGMVWDGESWVPVVSTLPDESYCVDEDTDHDGILDPGEDYNGNGTIEAGGDALVAAVASNAPLSSPCSLTTGSGSQTDVVTNAQGIARVCVIYPQNYALWLEVEIEAQSSVSGTEYSASQQFLLDVLAEDVNNDSASPPNYESPYGFGPSCADPN